ncbi:hypothetical protein RM550_13450 [Streptomyces sp. DSM 41527]|uniref:Uncharacterized protein n=1 Tax=Streptomyces mooreae TaxID=3075523 RepID=A0ABU2T6S4_9ACTN|nr:hypothetical protein [Streptomyces sp. DSM 41527]MDT0456730.1 hypothetical protein [Streptomyces sp. DSM 41527]
MRAKDRLPGSGSGRAQAPRAARTTPSPAGDAALPAAAGKAGGLAPEAAAALQRAVGNAAFSAALASLEQHRHSPACGHTAPPPVQRSTVQDVLRTPGRPLDDPVRTDRESRLGTAGAPGRGSAGERPVQRTFHLGNKAVRVADDVLPVGELIKRGKLRHERWDEDFKAKVREEIVSMAADDQDFGRKTYVQLLDTAEMRLRRASAAHLAPVVPTAIKTGSGSPDPQDGEVELSESDRRRRLTEVRRRLSLRSTEQNLDAFRNRQKMVNPFKHKPTGHSYSIGHTGNFVLGGPQEGEYEALFERARNTSGLSDEELAKHFIRALTESGYRFDGMSEDGRKYCTKVVAIIQGAEFRRTAVNPTVAIAAFNQVVTGSAGTLHEALNTYAVFAKAKGTSATGGSKDSQFHRDPAVDQEDEDIKRRMANEYRALAQLVAANGFDPNDEEEFYAGCDKIAATSMGALTATFEYAMP